MQKWFPEGVRARLFAAFVALLLAAVLLACVGWMALRGTQSALEDFDKDVLPGIAQALELAERTAQLAAIAPHLAESRTRENLQSKSDVVQSLLNELKRRSADLQPSGELRPVLGRLLDGVGRDLSRLISLTQQKQRLQAQLQREIVRLDQVGEQLRQSMRQGQPGRQPDPAVTSVWSSLVLGMTSTSESTLGELEADVEALMLAAQRRGALAALDPQAAAALREIVDSPHNILALRRSLGELEQHTNYLVAVTRTNADQLSSEVAEHVAQLRATATERSARVNRAIRSGETGMLAIALVSMLIAAVAIRYVWRLVAQVERITDVMSRLAQGDTAQPTPATSRCDELGALARTFEVFRDTLLAKHQLVTDLKSQTDLLHAVHSSMTDGLAVFDRQGRMLLWNPQLALLLGEHAAAPRVGTGMRELLASFSPGATWLAPGLNHQPQPLASLQEADFAASGQIELRLPGGQVFDLRSRAMPDVGSVTLITDLTARRAVEVQVQHAQRLELLGQLTGGVAHDFNNHLGTVLGSLSLLQEQVHGLGEAGQARLQRALRATQQASALTRRLLAFARRQPLQAEAVPVDCMLEEMRDLIEYSAGPLVAVDFELGAQPAQVHVDRGQLENALLNLVINSAAAMPSGGLLTVRSRHTPAGGQPAGALEAPASAGWVEIEIADTGTGIPDDVIPRVFEPFFTTKPVTEGSGLGLSIVYGFVKQSGGHIDIQSRYGSGTRVTLVFPASRSVPAARGALPMAAESPSPAADPTAPAARVLLVDDDDAFRTTVHDMLQESGARVVAVSSGEAALDLLRRPDGGGAFDAVLSDLRLGEGIDGLRLRKAVRQVRPGLGMTLMSGLSPEMLMHDPDWDGGLPFLQKPFDRDVLRRWLAHQQEALKDFSGPGPSTSPG